MLAIFSMCQQTKKKYNKHKYDKVMNKYYKLKKAYVQHMVHNIGLRHFSEGELLSKDYNELMELKNKFKKIEER